MGHSHRKRMTLSLPTCLLPLGVDLEEDQTESGDDGHDEEEVRQS